MHHLCLRYRDFEPPFAQALLRVTQRRIYTRETPRRICRGAVFSLQRVAPQACNGRYPLFRAPDLETPAFRGSPIWWTDHSLSAVICTSIASGIEPDIRCRLYQAVMFRGGVLRSDSKLDFTVLETSHASSLACYGKTEAGLQVQ